MAATALLRLAALTGRDDLADAGPGDARRRSQAVLEQAPTAAGQSLIALDFLLATPQEFAVIAGDGPRRVPRRAARRSTRGSCPTRSSPRPPGAGAAASPRSSPCWPIARLATGGRRPTSASGSPARRRSSASRGQRGAGMTGRAPARTRGAPAWLAAGSLACRALGEIDYSKLQSGRPPRRLPDRPATAIPGRHARGRAYTHATPESVFGRDGRGGLAAELAGDPGRQAQRRDDGALRPLRRRRRAGRGQLRPARSRAASCWRAP